MYPCPLCERLYANTDTIVQHCARDHHRRLNSVDAIYGHRCPACGRTFEKLASHASRGHGRPLALLFAAAKYDDPHGVVADLHARYIALLLPALPVDPFAGEA